MEDHHPKEYGEEKEHLEKLSNRYCSCVDNDCVIVLNIPVAWWTSVEREIPLTLYIVYANRDQKLWPNPLQRDGISMTPIT